MPTLYKGIFVDDQDEDYADLLSCVTEPGLTLEYKKNGQLLEFARELFEAHPDIIAVDYRLDENVEAGIEPYKAGPLVQQLRDLAIEQPEWDMPIVLVSAEDKIRNYFDPDKTTHDLFDALYVKHEIPGKRYEYCNELMGLIDGYRQIKATWGEKNRLLPVLKLPVEEAYVVDYEELQIPLSDSKAAHLFSRILIRDVVKRTGILLSWDDVRARLGVAFDSPDQDRLAEIVSENDVQYKGAFSKAWDRWWSHRFDEYADEVFGVPATGITGEERVVKLNAIYDLALKPAVSRWSSKSDELFAFSCAVCHHPTEHRHSISAYDPRAPRHGQKKRICWDCVRKDRVAEKGERWAATEERLVEKIRTNQF
jgi:hypothetical protein